MKKYWLIELDSEIDPHEKYGKASFSAFCQYQAFKNAVEAMKMDTPKEFQFSGILEKNGGKTDWEPIELFAIRRPK